jgi:hypothetical protein
MPGQTLTVRNSDAISADYLRAATRFYQSNGGWFYATREGEHGPFPDRAAAEADARRYTGLQSHIETARQKRDV